MEKHWDNVTFRWLWIIALGLLTLVLGVAGAWYHVAETERIRGEKYREIAAIAELKAGRIQKNLDERLADARRFSRNRIIADKVQVWLQDQDNVTVQQELLHCLHVEEKESRYHSVFLLEPSGKVLLHSGYDPGFPAAALMTVVNQVLSGHAGLLTDLYRSENGMIYLDSVAPVHDRDGRPIAVLVMRSNARTELFVLVQSWPTPSRTAETLLVRREGDEVLFLNNLRHKADSALKLRESINLLSLPAVQAALGNTGFFQGKDYRGQEVLADLRAIDKSPWFMVSKVDADEILSEAGYRSKVIAVFSVLVTALAAGITAYVYKHRQTRLYRALYKSERERGETQERFRATLYSIGDGVISTDSKGAVSHMNPVAERLTGWSEEAALGRPLDQVFRIVNEKTGNPVESPVPRVLREGLVVGLANHTILISKDGTQRPIADSGAPIFDRKGAICGVVLVFRDQTSECSARKELLQQYENLANTRKEAAFLAQMLERSSQAFAVGFIDGTIGTVNEAFCRLVGYSKEELSNLKWVEILTPPEWIPDEFAKLEELKRTGRPVRYEKEYLRKDGTRVPVELFTHLAAGNPGEPPYYYAFITDITARKVGEQLLKESEARVRKKLDSILLPDEDIGTLELSDVIDAENTQLLMDDFVQFTKIAVSISDLKGRILVKAGWHDLCVKFHRANPESRKNCVESDTELSRGVEPGSFRIYKCRNNLEHVVTPIIVGGKHLGNVFLGQFVFEDDSLDYETFRSQAAAYGFDEQEYLAALERIPHSSKEMIGAAISFNTKLAQILSTLSFSNIKLARSLAERDRLVKSLSESEARFRRLVQLAPVPMCYIDGHGSVSYLNDRFVEAFGYFYNDVPTVNEWWRLAYPDEEYRQNVRHSWQSAVKKAIEEQAAVAPTENRIVCKDGTIREVEITGIAIEDNFLAIFVDVTARKIAEDSLRHSEKAYRELVENLNDIIFSTDTDGVFTYASPQIERILGYRPSELIGIACGSLIHEEDFPQFVQKMKDVLDNRVQPGEFRIRNNEGEYRWFQISSRPIIEQGVAAGLTGVASDITEAKRLAGVQKRLSTAVEQAAEAVVITDPTGVIQYVNPAMESMSGYRRDEILGQTPRILKSGEHDADFYSRLWGTITSGNTWSGRFINRRKDGSLFNEDASISPIRDASGKITNFVAVKRDITEHLKLSNQLFQAQKMEAVGTLAGGVAHDFNNLLQIILGYSELILADKRLDKIFADDLRNVYQAAKNGADLVHRLLTFSRKTEAKPRLLNLNTIIRQIQKMLFRTIPKMISIELVLAEDLALVSADPTQMDQILMNLAVNARDAMPDGGKLIIQTANAVMDYPYVKPNLVDKPGNHVLLSVSDTGHGMDSETVEHIFEPFFTTKGPGEGTGLGLAMVYGIVKQHGGQILCYSRPSIGTTFTIHFPAVISSEQSKPKLETVRPQGGSETILMVDDEAMIREIGSRILKQAGYKVFTLEAAGEAIAFFEAHKGEVDLVILDLIMPEMSGRQCLEKLLKMDPSVKVIIASGYSADGPEKASLEAGAKGFVAKPFEVGQFLQTVRQILDQKVSC